MQRKYYRVDEVAAMFCRTTRTVRRWLDEGSTPLAVLPNSRPVLIAAESVETFRIEGFRKK